MRRRDGPHGDSSMKIFGLNVGGNSSSSNGRGWTEAAIGEFRYLPIEEVAELDQQPVTFRDLHFDDVKYPHLPAHYDPEFETFTYGHKRRGFGDSRLWALAPGDILFFFSTLDLLPDKKKWSVYIIGHFVVERTVDTRGWTPGQVKSLGGFDRNAHLKHKNPGLHLDLLIKGSAGSGLYRHALPLSHAADVTRLHPDLVGKLTTPTGKPVAGRNWWRWLLCSEAESLRSLLMSQPTRAPVGVGGSLEL